MILVLEVLELNILVLEVKCSPGSLSGEDTSFGGLSLDYFRFRGLWVKHTIVLEV